MPTEAEQQVLTLLDEKQGVVDAVARQMNVSPSWVSRIKKRLWSMPGSALDRPKQPVSAEDIFKALLPPNIDQIQTLRDDVITALQAKVNDPETTARDLTRILAALLRYETQLRQLVQPAIGAIDNRRFVQVNLIDRLEELDSDQLRALTGVPEPLDLQGITTGEYIDGEITQTDSYADSS